MSKKKEIKLNTSYRAPSVIYAMIHFLIALFFLISVLTLYNGNSQLGSTYVYAFYAVGTISILFCAAADFLGKKLDGLRHGSAAAIFIRLLPLIIIIAFIILAGYQNQLLGMKLYLNTLFTDYNELHGGGIELFKVYSSDYAYIVFSVVVSSFTGCISYFLIGKDKVMISCIAGFIILFVTLTTGTFSAFSAALYISAVLGSWLSPESNRPMNTPSRLVWLLFSILFTVVSFITSSANIDTVDTARKDIADGIHTARYGSDKLPMGDLSKASRLAENNDEEMLLVNTEQEKQLYLKGYVGSVYNDAEGKWTELSASAYGGEYYGMLKWLSDNGFDPLTQPAQYYRLSALDLEEKKKNASDEASDDSTSVNIEPAAIPIENNVTVNVIDASRYPVYIPSSLSELKGVRGKEHNDQHIISDGLVGEHIYSYTEYSGLRPNELTIGADWLTEPSGSDEEAYCENEALYRSFVYDNYTAVPQNMRTYINNIFWKDYHDKGSGIYSALSRVRKVLEARTSYAAFPEPVPDGTNELKAFLDGTHSGNSCLYATAAAEALRVYGIPARYTEGYYISSSDTADSTGGTVSVTGKNAHAWVEIYFDGIGWLPADVTPGYYYDAISLQQIVGTPDTIHQTAALDDSDIGAESITATDKAASALDGIKRASVEAARNLFIIAKGLIAAILILFVRLLIVAELVRALVILWYRHRYDKADEKKKCDAVTAAIFRTLYLRGCNARLGWNVEETDKQLSSSFNDIDEGEYKRINSLMEKSLYGQETLKAFELRTLTSFMEKLTKIQKGDSFLVKFKLRYIWLLYNKKKVV